MRGFDVENIEPIDHGIVPTGWEESETVTEESARVRGLDRMIETDGEDRRAMSEVARAGVSLTEHRGLKLTLDQLPSA